MEGDNFEQMRASYQLTRAWGAAAGMPEHIDHSNAYFPLEVLIHLTVSLQSVSLLIVASSPVCMN